MYEATESFFPYRKGDILTKEEIAKSKHLVPREELFHELCAWDEYQTKKATNNN